MFFHLFTRKSKSNQKVTCHMFDKNNEHFPLMSVYASFHPSNAKVEREG